MKNLVIIALIALISGTAYSQKRRNVRKSSKPAAAASVAKKTIDEGKIEFRTYSNETFNFTVTFPDSWIIPDSDYEAYMKSQGYDLSLKAPAGLSPAAKNKIKRDIKKLTVLVTAYKKIPGMDENAIVRISVEDLKSTPQIKDAVDYIDGILLNYKGMRLPSGYKFSDTQAEKLGKMQFAYLDSETPDDKRRMYATVRNGHALLFTISYTDKEDLEVLRKMLSDGNFALNKRL